MTATPRERLSMSENAAARAGTFERRITSLSANGQAEISLGWLVPTLYILFLMVPIYWLLNMSFKTTNEILREFTLWPRNFTLENYHEILTNPVWYNGYINSITYVSINTIISVTVALPAAYAFSRYRFLGDKHLFFWLLTNRMAPAGGFRPAVLPALFSARPVRHANRSGAGALSLQHSARGVDPGRLHVRRAEGNR